jgi:hypothetical protein
VNPVEGEGVAAVAVADAVAVLAIAVLPFDFGTILRPVESKYAYVPEAVNYVAGYVTEEDLRRLEAFAGTAIPPSEVADALEDYVDFGGEAAFVGAAACPCLQGNWKNQEDFRAYRVSEDREAASRKTWVDH